MSDARTIVAAALCDAHPEYNMLLMACADVIDQEIAAGLTQTDIAKTYALAMYSAARGGWEADWQRVNGAIVARWSMAGLERVKKLAHKAFPDG